MCRVEHFFYTCGHTDHLILACDYAQTYGPLFNSIGCPHYTYNSSHVTVQCGTPDGFYCGKTQNGALIEKGRAVCDASRPLLAVKVKDYELTSAVCAAYRSEAARNNVPFEKLASFQAFQNAEKQCARLFKECDAIRTRCVHFNNLINFASHNRADLQPGVGYQPLWDGTSFDFADTIFPDHILAPFRRQLPGHAPTPFDPVMQSIEDTPSQHTAHTQPVIPLVNNYTGTGSQPRQQAMQPSRLPTMRDNRTVATNHGAEDWRLVTKEDTPEGEDPKARVDRFRARLKPQWDKMIGNSMTAVGYDVASNGIKPPPKIGSKANVNLHPAMSKKLTLQQIEGHLIPSRHLRKK